MNVCRIRLIELKKPIANVNTFFCPQRTTSCFSAPIHRQAGLINGRLRALSSHCWFSDSARQQHNRAESKNRLSILRTNVGALWVEQPSESGGLPVFARFGGAVVNLVFSIVHNGLVATVAAQTVAHFVAHAH